MPRAAWIEQALTSPSALDARRQHAHRAPRTDLEHARVAGRSAQAGRALERDALEEDLAVSRAPLGLEAQLARRRAGDEQALGALALAVEEPLQEDLAVIGGHQVPRPAGRAREIGGAQRELEAARGHPEESSGRLALQRLEAQPQLEVVGHERGLEHEPQATLRRELVPGLDGGARAEHQAEWVGGPVAPVPRARPAVAEVVAQAHARQGQELERGRRENALELALGVLGRALVQAGADLQELGALALHRGHVGEVLQEPRDPRLGLEGTAPAELGVEDVVQQALRLGLARRIPRALLQGLVDARGEVRAEGALDLAVRQRTGEERPLGI